MNKLLIILFLWLTNSCAVEVGNPHPTEPGKSGLKLEIEATGALAVDQISLNLVGVKLIRKDVNTQNIGFASSRELVFSKTSGTSVLEVQKGTTNNTGFYSKVRLYFDKEVFGSVKIGDQTFPLMLTQMESFFDVPVDFELKNGELTKITLSLAADKLIQEIKDAAGQITGYHMSSDFAAQAQRELESSQSKDSKASYKQFRIAIRKVNQGNEVRIRRLKLMIENNWYGSQINLQDSILNSISGLDGTTYLMGPYPFSITASTNGKDAWKAFNTDKYSPENWESDSEFSLDTGLHKTGEFEYLEITFAQNLFVHGYEFSGDGDDRNCAAIYEMQGSNNGTEWQTIFGSKSTLDACELVNVNW